MPFLPTTPGIQVRPAPWPREYKASVELTEEQVEGISLEIRGEDLAYTVTRLDIQDYLGCLLADMTEQFDERS